MGLQFEPAGLPARERSLFVEQFEKDLKFLQLFVLLVNKSCPIKRVDLVWAENGPAGRVGLRQKTVCTERALEGPCARLLKDENPFEPVFCNIVNARGEHEAESCAISDRAAVARAGASGRPEVYRCHAGLVDIAVPVICEGEHIATLLTGQVLGEAPSETGFVQIRKGIEHLTYIDFDELEKAYWKVPVVSDADIQSTVQVMEVFAEYLATKWLRLCEVVRQQQRKNRELQLYRKEFAHIVLEGMAPGRAALRELMENIGFRRYPNRVILVKLQGREEPGADAIPFDLELTRAVQAVEELCDELPDVACTYLRDRGLCLFFRDRRGGSSAIGAQTLASKVLSAIEAHCGLRARAGIGEAKADWHSLLNSYHEAVLALAASTARVAVYSTEEGSSFEELSPQVARISQLISARRLAEVRPLLHSLLLEVNRELAGLPESLGAQRRFLSYALDSFTYSAGDAGVEAADNARLRAEGERALQRANSVFELHETFLGRVDMLLAGIRQLYSGKREKLVERARRKIEQMLSTPETAQAITVNDIASGLGISPGHLSRVFKRVTGMTLERYIMAARVEVAKRMLLEPLSKIAEVAESCGFTDPAYFARVFRKIAGCSPRDYREAPARFAAAAAGQGASNGELF